MKKFWIRSLIFNIAFYGVTAFFSVAYIPGLLLSQKQFGALIRFWLRTVTVLEYTILGLRLKIVGREYLPQDGSYIVAAKHQSAYETLKLHLLFRDPAVILKRELLWIPLFGSYLQKSGAIAIDRSTPETAHQSIRDGALRVMEEGRPIVIFPQGTRVGVDAAPEQKPYKVGVARLQETTGLPIIPLAMNSGVFWPRNSFFKQPGTVTFQILPPIPAGKDRQIVMQELEKVTETASNELAAQVRKTPLSKSKTRKILKWILWIFTGIVIFGFYCVWWHIVERKIQSAYASLYPPDVSVYAYVSGFPGPMHIHLPQEKIQTAEGIMVLKEVHISGFPLPFALIHVTVSEISVQDRGWRVPLTFQNLEGYLSFRPGKITIHDSVMAMGDFRAGAYGTVDISDMELPVFDLMLQFINHQIFLAYLAEQRIIDRNSAFLINAGFTTMMDSDGIVHVPVTQRDHTLYAGPFAFAEIPQRKPVITDPLSGATGSLPAPSP